MRITNRVTKIRETRGCVETIITERITEDEQYMMLQPLGDMMPQQGKPIDPEEVMIECNICTFQFPFDNGAIRCCPACGSKDVSPV